MEEGKRGELWIVEKGKKGKFHLCGERQGGQGSVLVIGALLRARCLLLTTSVTEYQEFEGCSRVPALGMF